ncbi:TPA: trp operon leader peptide [Salmonella enterica]|uniref:trp operon leader peptide n=1 Tax=Salmonella enterica TaxID=28901 RepID=A0A701ZBR5_SALER|nr:trp operon leader peptide [Salmonella enterica]EBH9036857.1 trp operon leader peptide [Salmonella enterica subsp. indica serovar 11:b:e,n,x]HAC6573578.1 trp operon leader peptide [Salmonella enterica subsp. indica]HBC0060930.1 trp operon leader peptide [Salmonella enterica]HBC0141137.1 trp operon leader peptide [Salmonella enterica subsp. indica serovar 11:b:e,n,x]HBC0157407.1 trp operon leader peptide [Salmonella enterica subsp. indica]
MATTFALHSWWRTS